MNKKGIAIVGMLVSLLLVLLIAGIILLIVRTGFGEGTEATEETTESLLNAVFRATGREPAEETNETEEVTPPPEPVCGDGVVEGDEECDDGNTNDGDGCSSDCKYEVEEVWLNPNQRYSHCIDFCPDRGYSGGGECMSESYSYDECIADRGTVIRLTGTPLVFCQRTYGDEPYPLCCCYG